MLCNIQQHTYYATYMLHAMLCNIHATCKIHAMQHTATYMLDGVEHACNECVGWSKHAKSRRTTQTSVQSMAYMTEGGRLGYAE